MLVLQMAIINCLLISYLVNYVKQLLLAKLAPNYIIL